MLVIGWGEERVHPFRPDAATLGEELLAIVRLGGGRQTDLTSAG